MDVWNTVITAAGVVFGVAGTSLAAYLGFRGKRLEVAKDKSAEFTDTLQEQYRDERERREEAERRFYTVLGYADRFNAWVRDGSNPPPPEFPIDDLWRKP